MSFHSHKNTDLVDLFGASAGLATPALPPIAAQGVASLPWDQPAAVAHLPVPATERVPATESRYARHGKRVADIVLGTIALVLSLPVLAILAALLWIEGGNPFFTQERVGRGGRSFRMFKLRTMVPGAEALLETHLSADPVLRNEWNTTQKLRHDPRVTPVGQLVRKLSLDELPQIVNVLRGDMSLVGPRPMLPAQMPLYLCPEAYLPLRPGLTGLWQVTARNDESFEIRAVLDQRYMQRISPVTDLRIMLATVSAVLRGTGC